MKSLSLNVKVMKNIDQNFLKMIPMNLAFDFDFMKLVHTFEVFVLKCPSHEEYRSKFSKNDSNESK